MIKVFQIQLSDAELAAINRGEETEKSKAYFARSYERTFKADHFEHYTHVANVYTNDMEVAFHEMNLWEDVNMVETFADRNCSSMSVGDILELEDGSRYRCASFGFTSLEGY